MYTSIYFYMFIVCLNTMTSMITTHPLVNVIDFQVHGRRRKHEFGHVDPACEAFEEVLHPHRSIDAVEVSTGQGRRRGKGRINVSENGGVVSHVHLFLSFPYFPYTNTVCPI